MQPQFKQLKEFEELFGSASQSKLCKSNLRTLTRKKVKTECIEATWRMTAWL